MTTRYNGFWVELEEPMREDDFDALFTRTLGMLKYVKSVTPMEHAPTGTMAAVMRRDRQWRSTILRVVDSGPEGEA